MSCRALTSDISVSRELLKNMESPTTPGFFAVWGMGSPAAPVRYPPSHLIRAADKTLEQLDPDWQRPAKSQLTAVSVILSAGREE